MTVRKFETGATRDADDSKLDFEGFLSPLTLQRYGEYMHRHRKLSDGSLRDSDNWQKGIPFDAYMKSLWRHLKDAWTAHRGFGTHSGDNIEEELCAVIFNASGYLHELLHARLDVKESAPITPRPEEYYRVTGKTGTTNTQSIYNENLAKAKAHLNKWSPEWALGELSTHPAAAEALREIEERDIKPWKS